MSARLKLFGMLALVLAVVAGLAFYWRYETHIRYFQETNDATIQADQVAISSKLAGYVRTVAVEDNQAVAQGALLAEIDPIDYEARLTQADAGIAAAQAAENAAQASQAESGAGIGLARAGLQAAQASLALANRELERYRPLVASGAEPAERLSQLAAERDRAMADIAAKRAALEQARLRVASVGAETRRLAAQVGAARAQRLAAANDLAATRLTAPLAGRIAGRSLRAGQFVQPGVRLMTIVPAQELYVVANFKETQVGMMRPGQPATIRVDALPGVEFRGTVASITPGTGANFSMIPPNNATGNFTKVVQRVPVRILIEAGPAARKVLAPGMSLIAEVDTRAASDEIEAIRAEQERAAR